jgi:hypothetical protein
MAGRGRAGAVARVRAGNAEVDAGGRGESPKRAPQSGQVGASSQKPGLWLVQK